MAAGRECVVGGVLYGTAGAVGGQNVGGSFYDFRAERREGTRAEPLAEPPDDWGGRALADWARRLSSGARFDSAAEDLVSLAALLDEVYAA